MRAITAIVLAYAIFAILVSPAVPSPMTTVRSKQMVVQPPHFVAPVSAMLFTPVIMHSFWLMEEPERLLTSGSDIVDLTTARLC